MTAHTDAEICFMSAAQLAALIRARKVSACEVMAAFLRQIERLNPKINAIVAKLDDEECLALAADADRRLAHGDEVGPLHGLPFAFKDLDPAVGFPMTRGSKIFKDFMPGEDSAVGRALEVKRVSFLSARPMSPSSAWARTLTTTFTASH